MTFTTELVKAKSIWIRLLMCLTAGKKMGAGSPILIFINKLRFNVQVTFLLQVSYVSNA